MKNIFFTLLLSAFALTCSSQDSLTIIADNYFDEPIEDGKVPFVIGSKEEPGYKLQIRTCERDETVKLPNGRMIAGLNCILSEISYYKGGDLTFNGDTTEIVSIKVAPVGDNEGEFVVEGKDFNMSFTLTNGYILAYENSYFIFKTKGVGIWRIDKK